MKTKPKNQTKSSQWAATRYANLFRWVPSGTIYARLKVRGKPIRKSLKTSDLELAKRRFIDLEKHERTAVEERRKGKLTFGEALKAVLLEIERDQSLKSRTKQYYGFTADLLRKTWPTVEAQDVRAIGAPDCQEWAAKFSAKYAPSVYNNTLALVRRAFEVAKRESIRFDNPAMLANRKPARAKKMTLPEPSQFTQFVGAIRDAGGRFSTRCADLVEFLAYGGFRLGEAKRILWNHCAFTNDTIHVAGDPVEGTKNGEFRVIPMIPDMRELLLRLKAESPDASPDDPVMRSEERRVGKECCR